MTDVSHQTGLTCHKSHAAYLIQSSQPGRQCYDVHDRPLHLREEKGVQSREMTKAGVREQDWIPGFLSSDDPSPRREKPCPTQRPGSTSDH